MATLNSLPLETGLFFSELDHIQPQSNRAPDPFRLGQHLLQRLLCPGLESNPGIQNTNKVSNFCITCQTKIYYYQLHVSHKKQASRLKL